MLFLYHRGRSLALKVVHIGQVTHDEPEGGALAYGALYAEAEAVLLEDGFGDGKPQTGALLARVRAGAVVPVTTTATESESDATSLLAALFPQEAKETAANATNKNTNFFIFFAF